MIGAGDAIGGPALASLIRIHLTYAWRHRRIARLGAPTRFTELVQLRKLHDRDPRWVALSDKLAVKAHISATLGSEWVIPALWSGRKLPPEMNWPIPLVVKSRHGCNQRIFVRSADPDWRAIRRKADRWVGRGYGYWLDEWVYAHIDRGLLIEPFMGPAGALPIDYKLYVFGGVVAYVQVHLDREHRHRWVVMDRNWNRMSRPDSHPNPSRPRSLPAMIEAAERLAREFDFVRVDFYEIDGRPMFGEMTFYPGSGLDPFDPVSLDAVMGAHWLAARASRVT